MGREAGSAIRARADDGLLEFVFAYARRFLGHRQRLLHRGLDFGRVSLIRLLRDDDSR